MPSGIRQAFGAALLTMLRDFHPGAAPALTEKELINPAYLPADRKGSGYLARLARLNDMLFIPNRDALLKALARRQSTLWCWQFCWDQEPAPWNTVFGAAHLFDMPFAFGNFGPSVFSGAICSAANRGGRLALSAAMMGAIGAFARTGDPNDPALGISWPVWPRTLVLDATLEDRKLSVR